MKLKTLLLTLAVLAGSAQAEALTVKDVKPLEAALQRATAGHPEKNI